MSYSLKSPKGVIEGIILGSIMRVMKGDTGSLGYSSYGLFSNIWALFGYRLYGGTSFLGVPKWDPNFGNYLYLYH